MAKRILRLSGGAFSTTASLRDLEPLDGQAMGKNEGDTQPNAVQASIASSPARGHPRSKYLFSKNSSPTFEVNLPTASISAGEPSAKAGARDAARPCDASSRPLEFVPMQHAVAARAKKRKALSKDLSVDEPSLGSRVHVFASAIILVLGVFIEWRSLPIPFPETWPVVQIVGVALGGVVVAYGVIAILLRSSEGRLAALFSRPRLLLGIVIAAATAIACLLDRAAGRSALALLCGSVVLSLLYWDKPPYLFALMLLAAAVGIQAEYLGYAAPDWEQVSLAASSLVLGAAVAFTVRGIVAPGAERLRSLERENRELWDLSFRDGLTGLYNRRFAQETGQKLFARAQRYQERFHVLMIDIDHFKRVNDKVSHAAGDEVLKGIASILQSCVRSSDVAARYGGEEFIVFLLQAEPETAQFIANRIRDDVAAHRFESVPWHVTISVGVAGMVEGERLDELVDRADKYLYVAKRGGRNRVAGF